jgi:RNA polymerase sigma factor (sigma-70 family)
LFFKFAPIRTILKINTERMTIKLFLEELEHKGNAVLATVYAQSRDACIRWILSRDKTKNVETAKDIFSDAVLVLMENAKNGKIQPSDTQVQTYLITTCGYIQNNQIGKTPIETDFEKLINMLMEQNPEEALDKEASLTQLEWAISQLKGNCSIIIKQFYLEDKSLEVVAQMCGITYDSAKALRLRCFNKLKNLFFTKK